MKTDIYETDLSHDILLMILRHFCCDLPALTSGCLLKLHTVTVQHVYSPLHGRILSIFLKEKSRICGEIEIDESYFGPCRCTHYAGVTQPAKFQFWAYTKAAEAYLSAMKN